MSSTIDEDTDSGSKHIVDGWDSFTATALPSHELEESPLLMQLLLDAENMYQKAAGNIRTNRSSM